MFKKEEQANACLEEDYDNVFKRRIKANPCLEEEQMHV